ncbi:hypothetical protein SARC_13020 [Sphaeroforma arctica JP610]|uniref:Uncharacterized protein n=1 Tax=Sphaeroforma arctica JP610 TaxID=667725 RepID=A0A0L0FCD6_9EUKA|nr:hypothetical protein SARC_13020 [Sphaeroforma arctica JP610]KNC74430.1 hypothetical protein SARC_13020 [Sphaeroforma arctica JP610]|eukprot:XP_014148332.1 hypothetical protein SARC_13020 [Sphaeroforma arctica JP610]
MSGPNKKKSMNVPYARDRRAVEADHKRSRSFIDLQHSRTNGSAGLNVNAKPYMKLEPGAPQYVFTQQQGYSGPADVSGQSDFDSYSSFVQPQQQNNFSAYFSGAQNTYLQQGTTQADYSVNQHTQTDYNNNGGNTSRDHDIHIQQQRQQLLQQQQQRQQQQQQHQHQTREFQSSSGLPQNQYGNQHKPGDTLNMLNLESQARNINNPEVGTFPTAIITASDNTHAAHSYYAGNLATGSSPMPNFHTGAYNFDMGLVKPDTTLDDDFQSLLDSAHLSAFDEADFDMSMMRNRAYAKLDGLVQPVHSVQSPTDTKLSVGDNAAHSVCSGESGDYDHVLRGM